MKALTPYQIEELTALLDIRAETIEDDPDSADEFETEDSLAALKVKIQSGTTEYTEAEKKWIIEECKCRMDMANGNASHEGIKVHGLINSMQNIIDKITP